MTNKRSNQSSLQHFQAKSIRLLSSFAASIVLTRVSLKHLDQALAPLLGLLKPKVDDSVRVMVLQCKILSQS